MTTKEKIADLLMQLHKEVTRLETINGALPDLRIPLWNLQKEVNKQEREVTTEIVAWLRSVGATVAADEIEHGEHKG